MAFNTPVDLIQLAKHSKWSAILHYNGVEEGEISISFVDDADFFLAEKGATHLHDELLATIESLITEPNTQCRFPGRSLWLQQQIPTLKAAMPKAECEAYLQWRQKLNTQSVVLVFASSQLNSPSSMYGHTFFRFDPPNLKENSTYLSYALNFGANIPPEEGGLLYTIKGLSGGYPGYFAANPYFEKIKEYTRNDNRDLWEYKLDITAAEIDLLMAHVWEMRDINFDYYFFDENCAFRLLELIDVVKDDIDLSRDFPGTTTPVDTVRAFNSVNLITDINYRPSVLTQLNFQLQQLNDEQRELTYQLSENIETLTTPFFQSQAVASQQLIIDSAYRYLRYLNVGEKRNKAISKRSFALLKQINKTQHEKIAKPEPPQSPEQGHKTSLWGASVGEQNNEAYLDMTYRTTYHDLLDPILGYPQGMSLNMGKLVIRAIDDSLQLEQAELLDITSLSPRNLFLSPWSWQANVSLERQYTDGKDKLVAQGRAGGGVTYAPFEQGQAFFMLTSRLEYNTRLKSNWSLAPGWHLGYRHVFAQGNTLIEAKKDFFFDDISRTQLGIAQSVQLAPQHNFIFHAHHYKVDNYSFNKVSFEYRQYF